MNSITIEELMKLQPETITVLDVRPADVPPENPRLFS